jgi:hypothetical protein
MILNATCVSEVPVFGIRSGIVLKIRLMLIKN